MVQRNKERRRQPTHATLEKAELMIQRDIALAEQDLIKYSEINQKAH